MVRYTLVASLLEISGRLSHGPPQHQSSSRFDPLCPAYNDEHVAVIGTE